MRIFMLLGRLVASAVLLAAPGAAHAGPKIGVLLKSKSGFWDVAARGARSAAEPIGAELVILFPQSESDSGTQIQMLNTLMDQGCEAVVLAPGSREALVEPVAAAVARGVKVVIIDTPLARDVAPVFVGTDQTEAGRAAGRLLAAKLVAGDHVALFRHNQTSGVTEQREAGILEALKAERPGLVVNAGVYASMERGMETARASFLLNQDAELKAVIASGTPGTMAMLHVLNDRGLAGKIRFVGFGSNLTRVVDTALENGAMDAWVAQLPGELGRVGVETAAAMLRGETLPATISARFEIITRENRRDPEIRALLLD